MGSPPNPPPHLTRPATPVLRVHSSLTRAGQVSVAFGGVVLAAVGVFETILWST